MKADRTDLLNAITASLRDIKEEAAELDQTQITVGMNLSVGRGQLQGEWRTLQMLGGQIRDDLQDDLTRLNERRDE